MRLTRSSRLAGWVDAYRSAPLSYAEVGATAGPLPAGYAHTRRRCRVGSGRRAFDRAAGALASWDMHRAAGLAVAAGGPAEEGATVVLGLGFGAVLVIPCRVVRIVDEPGHWGFAYGTLPGHPEQGEEAFVVRMEQDDSVCFEITAFSRPGGRLVRWAGPVARTVQRVATSRYEHALARLVA